MEKGDLHITMDEIWDFLNHKMDETQKSKFTFHLYQCEQCLQLTLQQQQIHERMLAHRAEMKAIKPTDSPLKEADTLGLSGSRPDLQNRSIPKRRMVFVYTLLSLAACFLLVVIIQFALARIKLNEFAAHASETVQMPVIVSSGETRGTGSPHPASSFIGVRWVKDDRMEGKYFVRKGILYLSSEYKEGILLSRISSEGKLDYLYQIPSGEIFELNLTKENRLLKFRNNRISP